MTNWVLDPVGRNSSGKAALGATVQESFDCEGLEQAYRILNVRSAASDDDRTARARIRDAAIVCFAERGVAGTSVRAIAAAASVSPGLVIHHYGSKDALRVACDQYVVERIYEVKAEATAAGLGMNPIAPVDALAADPPIAGYLARALVDDSSHVADLVDALVANGVALSEQAVANGLMNPAPDEYARAAVITIWSLGALVLSHHLLRLLGGSELAPTGQALAQSPAYLSAVIDILANPPLTETTGQLYRAALAADDPGKDST